jgi:hypothetical protein
MWDWAKFFFILKDSLMRIEAFKGIIYFKKNFYVLYMTYPIAPLQNYINLRGQSSIETACKKVGNKKKTNIFANTKQNSKRL